ncbi:thaumatin-like protein 1 isoform X1 [Andrographis paniculata]|uniref:thaumatin-like protein 1 isoform X1 n=1 Tax=Andrographis paniculata TaxID=175694 RepID=UPI0021E74C52|nr:thaumatin-like protein 1 isoform X1 [Andrographis paniculata]
MLPSLLHTFILLAIANGCLGTTFTLINRCEYTVWPGILSNAGAGGFGTTGFQLPQGAARSFQAGPGWSGRFWGRTGCVFDPATGQGSCATGDCGSNQIECNGAGAKPPATLAEFTIGSDTQDFYDVSLVDGYNLPMIVEAAGGSGACGSTGCLTDLNRICPSELRVGNGQACRSACEAFRRPEFCCSGAYGSPDTCRPSAYSAAFKKACPRAYSYAYDDATSTFTCNGADYTITFCPSLPSQKSSSSSSSSMPAPAAGGSAAQPQGDDDVDDGRQPESGWLPNFIIGGSSSSSALQSNPIIVSTIILLILILFLVD